MGSRTTYFNAFNCRPSYGMAPVVTVTSSITGALPFDETITCVAGETILVRDAVFVKSDGKVYKASAIDVSIVSSSFEIGFAISGAISGADIPVDTRVGKLLDGFSGLSIGSRYFLSESAGLISTTAPETCGSIVYQVGIAKTATDLLFKSQLLVRKFDPV